VTIAAEKLVFRYSSPLSELSAGDRSSLLQRAKESDRDVRERTSSILARVRVAGDRALFEMAREYDNVELQ